MYWALQYQRNDLGFARGMFRLKGDVLDISREELAQKTGNETNLRTVDVQITRLRRKIKMTANPKSRKLLPTALKLLKSNLAKAWLLRRRLEAANAEIRRYETRLFAYERAMLDLRRENAELQALCEQARAGETLPEPTPQPTVPVLEKPELPVIHFPAPARDAGVAQGPLPGEIETLLDTGTPEWEPKTKLDHLSVDIITQLEQLMGT